MKNSRIKKEKKIVQFNTIESTCRRKLIYCFFKKLNGKPEIRMLVGIIISKGESYFFQL